MPPPLGYLSAIFCKPHLLPQLQYNPTGPWFPSSTWQCPALLCQTSSPRGPTSPISCITFRSSPYTGLHPSKENSEGFPRAGTTENLTTSHRELLQLPDACPYTYTKILIFNRKWFHQIWQDHMISFHWSGSRGDKMKGHPGSLPRCWEAWYLQGEE